MTIRMKRLSPGTVAQALALLQAAQKALDNVPDDPSNTSQPWHSGFKVYGVCALTIATTLIMMFYTKSVSTPEGIFAIYSALALAAGRSTVKSVVASIVNAQVNPTSPAAQATAAEAPAPTEKV